MIGDRGVIYEKVQLRSVMFDTEEESESKNVRKKERQRQRESV